MFIALANSGLIAANAQQVAADVRRTMTNAQNFYAWLSAQADSDLTSLPNPIGESDIGLMRSMAADLSAFNSIYHGQAPPNTYTLPYAFINSSTQIIGPGS